MMMTVASQVARVPGALSKRIRLASKRLYQALRWRGLREPRVLFIVGCQRSGTTMIAGLFDRDLNCRVFAEHSELSSADREGRLRLNPLPEVAARINRAHAPLVVIKPLVETQNVGRLLGHFQDSRALFVYRRYADVARSDIAKFGERNAVHNLRTIATGDARNWRSAGASLAVRELARRFYSPDMNPNDAAALFWYARNQLFFDLDLADHPAVMLCSYEHVAAQPDSFLRRVYRFLGADCPTVLHTRHVRPPAAERPLALSSDIDVLCRQLQTRLDAHLQRDPDDLAAHSGAIHGHGAAASARPG